MSKSKQATEFIEVKCKFTYFDKELNKTVRKGDTYIVSLERAQVLKEKGFVI